MYLKKEKSISEHWLQMNYVHRIPSTKIINIELQNLCVLLLFMIDSVHDFSSENYDNIRISLDGQ